MVNTKKTCFEKSDEMSTQMSGPSLLIHKAIITAIEPRQFFSKSVPPIFTNAQTNAKKVNALKNVTKKQRLFSVYQFFSA